MNSGRRRQRNGRARPVPQTAALARRLASQESRMMGTRTRPPLIPKTFVQYPWNSWTYESVFTTTDQVSTFSVTVQELTSDLSSKLGLDSLDGLRLKIQSAQVWCTASSLVYPSLQADFYEINGNQANAASVRSTQIDKGTLNAPARAGYLFPVSDSKDVLNDGDTGLNVVAGKADTAGSVLTFRVHILWQKRPTSSYVVSTTM